jgi:transporter family protein
VFNPPGGLLVLDRFKTTHSKGTGASSSEVKTAARTLIMQWFFWALSSAFFAGVTALLAKIGVSGLNSNLATAIRTSVILVFSWAIVFVTSGSVDVHSISRKTWIFLVLSGIATGLSWLCYFRALQIGELSKVAPVDKLSVVMAMTFGVLFLHEHLTAREGIGGFFIAAGALILAWR